MEAATTMRFILGWRCLTYRPTASTMALPMWRRTVREVSERNVDLLIARSFGPIADGQLGFEFLLRTHMSSRRARKVHGHGGGESSLPNW